MISEFSIENMKAELARAGNKADEDAKTISDLSDTLLLVHKADWSKPNLCLRTELGDLIIRLGIS